MSRNNEIASTVRSLLAAHGVSAINLVSSPGSGKTTLLERTLATLGEEMGVAVITGDVQTQNDADRLAAHTSRVVTAVVTGGACHLDALQVLTSIDEIDLDQTQLLFIENVGNLVCPSSYDLGEALRLVLLSVTEGEDKPLKYPTIYNTADVAVITKIDLAEAVEFDREAAHGSIQAVRPGMRVFELSAKTGAGMDAWLAFLRARCRDAEAAT